jgi:hypothetical protein
MGKRAVPWVSITFWWDFYKGPGMAKYPFFEGSGKVGKAKICTV